MPLKRPPIVAIMGHVDHGKTTLLDHIRKTNVASKEAGGITQSMGAYEITHADQKITFIDTPGHEAFSKMRGYGSQVADLAILVVAADDGVKTQTKDALKYILKEQIPFIVAINKTDKSNANVEKTKTDLAQNGVFLEGSGGDISWNAISAKTGAGVHELLDHILLTADVEGLTYDPETLASGTILSCTLDSRRGLIIGAILQNGSLRQGDAIGTLNASGKVKILQDFRGKVSSVLSPSSPAIIVGFEDMPEVGEEFFAHKDKETLLHELEERKKKMKAKEITLPNQVQQNLTEEKDFIYLIVKADESASLEAVKGLIEKLGKTFPFVIKEASIGDIHEGEVKLAQNINALIAGFRVKTHKAAANLARALKITILVSSIIYELEKALEEFGKKAIPRTMRTIEVLAAFGHAKGKERIVGGKVILGPIKNQEPFEIWHEKKYIGKGKILNLQSGRKDVHEASTDHEVGLLVESEEPIKVGNKLIFD